MSFILLGILNAQAAGGGGAGAYDLLETQILSSTASSVEFTGLGSYADYKHLQLRVVSRRPSGGSFLTSGSIGMRLNGDTGSNYSWHRLSGDSSTVSSGAGSSASYGPDNVEHGIPNDTSGAFGASVWDILDFSNSSKNTTTRVFAGTIGGGSVGRLGIYSGGWYNTAAVTSILLQERWGSFAIGSRFSLYGVR